ncbi:MAG: flagellar basal body rod protein FlgB [Alphaproteobacteria bacterium]|nr:flagellar basal body rod protein FlgB [Alphaproteobacteria bacterium]
MDLNKISIFQALNERMNWLGQRQKVLAENIANQSTPDYKPRELSESDFAAFMRRSSSRMGLAASSGHSLGLKGRVTDHYEPEIAPEIKEVSPNGNAVVIEDQLMKVADNQAAYQTATNLYRKHLALIKLAIGRPIG